MKEQSLGSITLKTVVVHTVFPEVLIQAFLLAYITHYWVNHPEKKWIGWVLGIIFVLAILMSTMGILAGLGILQVPA